MGNSVNTAKSPMSQERIFLTTMIVTFAVAAIFLVKNLIGGNVMSAVIIAICLAVFGGIVFVMKKLNTNQTSQHMALSILLVVLVFLISISSGNYYSDDFPLFLALLGLTGLYLEPKCTIAQSCAAVAALIVMFVLHPEKADSPSQYFMCVAIFVIAAVINLLVIRRGRAYIDLANARAEEAARLIESIKTVSTGLQNSYTDSTQNLRSANQRLDQNALSLRRGSMSVLQNSQDLAQACSEMQNFVQFTSSSIALQGKALENMVGIMLAGKDPMQAMHAQLKRVSEAVQHTTEVFDTLQEQIRNISALTDQLGTIAFNTKMLALNASVEAARAGEYGAGFSVVANEVQTLAADSDSCSNQVTDVVEKIKNQVNLSAEQLAESFQCVETMRNNLLVIDDNYMGMKPNFESLGQNIEDQTSNLSSMDSLFNSFQQKVSDITADTQDSRAAVDALVDGIAAYKAQMSRFVDETKELRDLSTALSGK